MGTDNFIVDSNFPDAEAAAEPEKAGIAPKEERKAKAEPDEETGEQNEDQESPGAEGEDDEENDSEESEENDSKEEPKPKKKSGFQKRLDRARRKLAEKDALIQALQAKVPAQKDQDEKPADEKKAQSDSAPNPDDFETQAEYVKALVKYERQVERKAEAEAAAKEKAKSEYLKQVEAHQARVNSYMKENPEYKQVLEDFMEDHGDLQFSPAMEELILTSDVGPQVLFELAKDKAEFDRLNSLGVTAAGREFGRIEARILTASSQKEETKQIPKTKAPAPISPVSGGGGAVAKSIHDPDLSFEDYERLRTEQMRKRA